MAAILARAAGPDSQLSLPSRPSQPSHCHGRFAMVRAQSIRPQRADHGTSSTPHFHNTEGPRPHRDRLQGIPVHRRPAAVRSPAHLSRHGQGQRNRLPLLLDALRLQSEARAPAPPSRSRPSTSPKPPEPEPRHVRHRPHHLHRRRRHRRADAGAGAGQVRRHAWWCSSATSAIQEFGAGPADQPQCPPRPQPARPRPRSCRRAAFEPAGIDVYPFRARRAAGHPGARRGHAPSASACPMR